ncbi:MAG: DUF4003 family protein [Atopobiaceae bacterium]|nr:DUF4003 family protein [Atopobiaceae bacterium]
MNQQEQQMVELLGANRDAVNKSFMLESATGVASAALIWTLAERRATVDAMHANHEILKSKTNVLSTERSTGKLALLSRMALSGDGATYLAEVRRIFAKIMEGKMFGTAARLGAAIAIVNGTSTPDEADRLLARTNAIFERMEENHPLITNDRDLTSAVIVALSDRDDDELLADAEECYELLGKGYKLTDGRQTMAHILAVSPAAPAEKVARVKELRDALRAQVPRLGWTSSQEYAVLAMLALDDRPAAELAANVSELYGQVKELKGFGTLSLPSGIRLLCAAAISMHVHRGTGSVEAITDAIALAVAQAIIDWIIYTSIIIAN